MPTDVGLDTVAFIESNYIKERGLSSEKTVDFLKMDYLDHGKLGAKSEHGGFYPPECAGTKISQQPTLLVLDIGLSAATPSLTSASILECSADGKIQRTLFANQPLPDGIAVDAVSHRLFWTNMGILGKLDGAVYSANLMGPT